MNAPGLQTPVAIFIFKRAELTSQVLAAIAQVRPSQLVVVADGPRNAEEAAKCQAARDVIDQLVAWDCQVIRHYSDANLGLKKRVSSGLDRVFEQFETAIILEDDTVPHPSLFHFCEALLDQYRDEPRVMHIAGSNNLVANPKYDPKTWVRDSYFFQGLPHVGGWATWQRAWQRYDRDLNQWRDPAFQSAILGQFRTERERSFWQSTWEAAAAGTDSWAVPWVFSCFAARGLAITPARNMITNIGYGADATHTEQSSPLANLPTAETPFPLKHPARIEADRRLDQADRDLLMNLLMPPEPVWTKPLHSLRYLGDMSRRGLSKVVRGFGLRQEKN